MRSSLFKHYKYHGLLRAERNYANIIGLGDNQVIAFRFLSVEDNAITVYEVHAG